MRNDQLTRQTATLKHPTDRAIPTVPGTMHIFLAVIDNGKPTLTRYRRMIEDVQPYLG
ncbi:hypothetical protein [Bythopirellula polymerisocia]|uniref:hypothetical protein n=1 Tax=Bythopirellula polymerisocia TaxID=2528003 RepID=UPI003704580D